jgi:hypothetical protein
MTQSGSSFTGTSASGAYNMNLAAPSGSGAFITLQGNGNAGAAGFQLVQDASGNAYVQTQNATPIVIATSGTTRVTIGATGAISITNVGANLNALSITGGGGTGSGLVITGIASQTSANINTTAPSGTTNYWRLGQPGIVNWDIQNVATTGVFSITNGSATPISSSQAGVLTVGTGTSAGNNALVVTGNSASAVLINGGNSTSGIGLSVTGSYTGAGNISLVILTDSTNTNGANLKLSGNGSNPSKTLRARAGNLELMNDAYSATLLSVTDSGIIQVTAGGAMRVSATAFANIPSAATAGAGAQVWITDSGTAYTGANINTIISTGGGANLAPLYSDGTNWKIG